MVGIPIGSSKSVEFCALASQDLQIIASELMGEWCKRRGVCAFFGALLRGRIMKGDRCYIHVYSIGDPSLADEVAKSKEEDWIAEFGLRIRDGELGRTR